MKAILQRVTKAKVEVDSKTVGEIGTGFLILLGVENGDTEKGRTCRKNCRSENFYG